MKTMKEYLTNKEQLVSIIIPVYNTPVVILERCFKSILKQTYKNIEIIIVNDGSSKKIADYCKDFFKDIKNAIIIEQKNLGVSEARNNGIKSSNGNYISFIDSDDFVEENYIQEMFEKIYNQDADIIFTTANKVYPNTIEPQKIYECPKDYLINDNVNKEFSPYNLDLIGTVWGKIYKRNCISNIKFDSSLKIGEDIEFNFRVFNSNLKYLYINTHSYQYIINPTSAIRKFDLDKINNYEKTLNKIKISIKNKINKEAEMTYYLWGCTFYRVIAMNYIFSTENKMSLRNKILMLKNLKEKDIYNDCFRKANLKELRFSRRVPIELIKKNCFFMLYCLIRIRESQVR